MSDINYDSIGSALVTIGGFHKPVKKIYETVGGVWNLYYSAKPSYDATFANNDWATIIFACQNNEVPSTWVVGNQKLISIGGTDYLIDIIGKSHDAYSDGSGTAPLTFQLHDCYVTSYAMSSSGTNSSGWTSSDMRATHLPAILALMPSEVQAAIKEVNKVTSKGNKSTTLETTADKLFLLSEQEVFGSIEYSCSGEGDQYSYYSTSSNRIKSKGGSTAYWWERSPRKSNAYHYCVVGSDGIANIGTSNVSYGVAPAFCF